MAELAKVDLANVIREECNPPMLEGDMSYHDITEQICSITEWKNTPTAWWVMISITGTLLLMLFGCLTYLVAPASASGATAVPVNWAWDITNFVFWIGIGHAGTLISAILCLLRQNGALPSTARPRR